MPVGVCVEVNNAGFVKVTGETINDCNQYILVSKSEYQVGAEVFEISAVDLSEAAFMGFALVVGIGWFSGLKIGAVLNIIKKM